MKKIESFKVDHTTLQPGFYVSRVDGDVTTFDMRVKKPNTEPLLSNAEMHSFEHMFATIIRNGELAENVVYFGPMGCQTGFYLLTCSCKEQVVADEVKRILGEILEYDGEIFGNSAVECGNYISLNLVCAKNVAREYLALFSGLNEYV